MINTLTTPRPPSPKQIRIAVASLFFQSGFGFSSFASRIPTLQQNLHINEAQLGTALFAIPFGLVCMLPLTGYLLGKYESRFGLVLGSIFYNLCLCLLGFVTNLWQLMAVLFVFGGARNLMNIAINAQSLGVQKLYPKSIITTFHGIWSITGFMGGALGGVMISHDITPATHFEIVGVICMVILVFAHKNTIQNDVRKPEDLQQVLIENRTIFGAKKAAEYMKSLCEHEIKELQQHMQKFAGVNLENCVLSIEGNQSVESVCGSLVCVSKPFSHGD